MIDELARLLPAQGPISIFIHHNTLHAFEARPFEEAVVHAGAVLGGEPFLAEARYREKLASGRIRTVDVDRLLRAELGPRADADVAFTGSRFDLWRAIVLDGIPAARGPELSWILEETPVAARDLAVEAKRIGFIDLRIAGDVVDLALDRLDPAEGRS